MSAFEIVNFLDSNNFDIYIDHWNEQELYFGKHGNVVMDIDKMFGSEKFKLESDLDFLRECAVKILSQPIDPKTFNQRQFLKSSTDIIAIERSLSEKMKEFFLPQSNSVQSASTP